MTEINNIDPFWLNNLEILLDYKRLSEFFPTSEMSFSEKLNAITRLSFYLSIVLYLYTSNYKFLFIFIIVLIITYVLFQNNLGYKNTQKIINKFHNFGNKKYPVNYTYPTKDNPFMNVLISDYQKNINREAMIKKTPNSKKIQEQIEKKFEINLYKDVGDIFGKENSQRQYYTNPITTIPNDQQKFAKWLYNIRPTCKEGSGIQCIRNNFNPTFRGSRTVN